MRVVAVMPGWNEAPRIGEAIRGILSHVDEVIVVDDGSHDETARMAREAGAHVLRHALNRGQGAALKTGTLAALERGADIVLHVDADGQHDPTSLPSVLEPVLSGHSDVAFGSRFLSVDPDGMPFARRSLLKAARVFNAYALGIPYSMTDPQSGLRALSSDACRQIDFRQDGRAHCSEILRLVARSGLRYCEVPTRVSYTSETLAKGNRTSHALEIVWELFVGVFSR